MLHIELAKSKMENQEGMNHLHIQVKPEVVINPVHKPIAFYLIVDTSSSMNAPVGQADAIFPHYNSAHRFTETASKISYVRQASERVIDMMKDGDKLGIVSFSNAAAIEYDLTTLNKDERYKAKDRIRKLQAGGMTNISDGLELAYKQIPADLKKTHHIKFILLSDGEANYGITNEDGIATLVSSYRKNDVSVSTIGVGLQYNSYFMETIATASGGMFYHLENMEQLNDILTKELETLSTLTTKQARLTVEANAPLQICPNLNGFKEDKKGEVFLGNVFNELDILVEVFTESKMEPGTYPVKVRLEYLNAAGMRVTLEQKIPLTVVEEEDMENVEVNQSVVELVKKLVEAKAKKDSLRYYEAGDMNNLRGNLQSTYLGVSKISNAYGVNGEAFVQEMKELEQTMMNHSLDKASTKNMYAASYSVLNNQNK